MWRSESKNARDKCRWMVVKKSVLLKRCDAMLCYAMMCYARRGDLKKGESAGKSE